MIKAEEISNEDLRFGNIINCGGLLMPYDNGTVVEILADSVTVKIKEGIYSYQYGDLKPIELSPSWLERAGFEFKSEIESWTDGTIELSFITTEEWFQYEIKFPYGNWKLKDLKYVHQLQNLYYALTGTELNFKQP